MPSAGEIARRLLEPLTRSGSLNGNLLNDLVRSLDGLEGRVAGVERDAASTRSPITEFNGDITAHGGDVNANKNSSTEDARFNLQTQQVTRGALWYDQDLGNVVLENDGTGSAIVINTQGGPVLLLSDSGDSLALGLDAAATAPPYVDGYALMYYYLSGATRQLRVRRKDGASELDTLIANI